MKYKYVFSLDLKALMVEALFFFISGGSWVHKWEAETAQVLPSGDRALPRDLGVECK